MRYCFQTFSNTIQLSYPSLKFNIESSLFLFNLSLDIGIKFCRNGPFTFGQHVVGSLDNVASDNIDSLNNSLFENHIFTNS